MPLVPISTERLLLRALTETDSESVFKVLGDETTTARVSWGQPSREAAQAWLARRVHDEHDRGLSMWAVEDRSSGEVIGLCGFFPKASDEVELGYVIHAPFWGRGFAKEAALAAVQAASLAGLQVLATIRPWNTASLRVARSAGLKPAGSIVDERGELLLFRSTRGTGTSEW